MSINVSDVILGLPSETPYDDLKDAILRRSKLGKAERVTLILLLQLAVLLLFKSAKANEPIQ